MRTLREMMRHEGLTRAQVIAALDVSESTLDRHLDQDWAADDADWKARLALWCAGVLALRDHLIVVNDPAGELRAIVASMAGLAQQIVEMAATVSTGAPLGETPMPDAGIEKIPDPPLPAPDRSGTVGSIMRTTDTQAYPGEVARETKVWLYPSLKDRALDLAKSRGWSLSELSRVALERLLADVDRGAELEK